MYVNGTVGEKRYGTSYNQTETATTSYTYGAWSYSDPTRTRTKTPVYTYSDVTRNGATTNESQTATTSTDWDGSTYWNGACGTNYYYVDYQKVRTKYTYSDTTRYGSYYNGTSRSRRIDGSCGWTRAWRVSSAWANTGETCDANGNLNGYTCDGTYSVKYYRQKQVESYCYPDMSGSTQTRTTYRAGSQYSRTQVDGQCGYSATANITIKINDSTFDGGTNAGTAAVKTSSGTTRTVSDIRNNTIISLSSGETLVSISIPYSGNDYENNYHSFTASCGSYGTYTFTIRGEESYTSTFNINRPYSSGSGTITIDFTQNS